MSTMNCQSTFEILIPYQLSNNRSFYSYLKPERRYASHHLSELTTVALTVILRPHFLQLRVRQTVNCTIPPLMWVRQTVRLRKVDPPNLTFLLIRFARHIFHSITSQLSTVGVENRSFQSYQNPANNGSSHSCRLWLSKLPFTWKKLCFAVHYWN